MEHSEGNRRGGVQVEVATSKYVKIEIQFSVAVPVAHMPTAGPKHKVSPPQPGAPH